MADISDRVTTFYDKVFPEDGVGDLQRGHGVIVAWSDEPQVLVRYDDGTQEWWLTRLTRPRGRHAKPFDMADLP